MASFISPFMITNRILTDVAETAELVGRITSTSGLDKNPTLRKENRIKTIHSSLAIENNTLSLEQVTAVIEGKYVIAPPKDIEEVKNAYEIYEHLEELNHCSVDDLLKSHGIMMRGLTEEAGMFRTKPAGVIDSKTNEIIHLGTLPDYVPQLVDELFAWLESSDLHPLIKSAVFHYEFEVIHPFLDGNGRTGRLWHTLILSKWNPIFAWLPVESMAHKMQEEYYKAFQICNVNNDSTAFIEFMLSAIKAALQEAVSIANVGTSVGINVGTNTENLILREIKDNSKTTAKKIAKNLNISDRQVERIISKLKKQGKVKRLGSNKNGEWIVL